MGDIVRGLFACAGVGRTGDVYNLASGVETSILELATRVNELTGNLAALQFLPQRTWDSSGKRFGSTLKAREVLGFTATVSLKEGLDSTIEWTRANLAFIDACVDRPWNMTMPAPTTRTREASARRMGRMGIYGMGGRG